MKGFDPSTGLGFIQNGRYVEVTLPYARKGGEGVLVGTLFGVCVVDGVQGDVINIDTEGAYGLTAATGASTDAAQGAIAYWDNASGARRVTPVAGTSPANTPIGKFLAPKATTDAAAQVRLD
jgi:predicted RecA/RadA family phage recombinase